MRPAPDTGSSSSSSSCGLSSAARPGERPKTEDFLTFLCLRGTDFLPPELDFFNQVTRRISRSDCAARFWSGEHGRTGGQQ